MGPVMGFKYHKLCFRCHVCERQLDFKNYRTNLIDLNDRELYCTAHNPRNGAFNDHIYGYNARSKSPGNEVRALRLLVIGMCCCWGVRG